MKIAVLMTVHNRREKTLRCLESLQQTSLPYGDSLELSVYLTDDGCTDGTVAAIRDRQYAFPLKVLSADGSLFWNAGMINSWKAAVSDSVFDGFLWLNDDTVVLPEFWSDLLSAAAYCEKQYGKQGIYVGSTKDTASGAYTYGGFVFTNKLTLKDKAIIPDGHSFQPCEAAHGNITYVSWPVFQKIGVLCDKYVHGGSDHDYTFLSQRAGFPLLVLPHYSGMCDNDHQTKSDVELYSNFSLKERLSRTQTRNALLFNRRCFPWRYPMALTSVLSKAFFPRTYHRLYQLFRGERKIKV